MQPNHESAPAPRLPLKMNIEFRKSYARQADNAVLMNISLTGAFLQLDPNEFELGPKDKLTITFSVSGRIREISASIVWKGQSGYGVQFHPFNNRDVQIVDDLIYFVENNRASRRDVLDSIFKVVS